MAYKYMLLNLEICQNTLLRRLLKHILYLSVFFGFIPAFLFFELCVVLPAKEKEWNVACTIHCCNAAFLFLNVVGNMIYGMFTNTTIKGKNIASFSRDDWTFCAVCECRTPPRAWHCTICDICVLKRDHHCTYFACCVGYFNQRYFMWFTFYIFVAMLYAFYYNVMFLSTILTWQHGLNIIKMVLPVVGLIISSGDFFCKTNLYIFLVFVNFSTCLAAGFLFFYHLNNILKGKVVHDNNSPTKVFIHDKGWRLNVIEVFGSKWYLTWISPFIQSSLPGNGFEWPTEVKQE